MLIYASIGAAVLAIGFASLKIFNYHQWRKYQQFTQRTAVKMARAHGKGQAMHYLKGKPKNFAQFVNLNVKKGEYDQWEAEMLKTMVKILKTKGLRASITFRKAMPKDFDSWLDEAEHRLNN